MTRSRPLHILCVSLALLAPSLSLMACDPGGRLAQLTPQPPAASPVVLGVTGEAPMGTPAPPVGAATTAPLPPATGPTATYDPARPAWTVLYYGGADNDHAAFVWDDLNEMEAGAPSDQVQIVAEVDWPEGGPAGTAESVRYHIRADADPQALASEVVATLGEKNQGDPQTLADFLTWAVSAYPANHTLLVLGDYGGGWRGCCLDTAAGAPGQTDHLSLTDIDQALAYAQTQTGARFEVVAFSAGLMSQLDVLQTLQPYAAYAVASPDLVAGASWDFQAVVAQLNGEPFIDGRQLAGDMVTTYVNTQRQLEGDEFASMAAVNLGRVPALSAAVEALARALSAEPRLYGELAGFARRGAQTYGRAALADADSIAAVDLSHAAALIAEVSPPGDVQTAATAVSAALTEALIGFDHGQGLAMGRGVALYWPGGVAAVDPLYSGISRLPTWAGYLNTFVGATAGNATRLTVDPDPRAAAALAAHIAQPAFLRAEIVAQRVGQVALVAGQETADGRYVLRQEEVVAPVAQTLPGGTSASLWSDGWHESLVVWDATGNYLADSAGAGDYVPLRAVAPSPLGPQTAARGAFRRAESSQAAEATVVFAPGAPASTRLWLAMPADSGARLIGEARPRPGDIFQPALPILAADGTLSAEPGVTLAYDDAPALYRSARPLPAGRYAVGLRVTALDNSAVAATQLVTVDPTGAPEGFRAYVDVANGAQFLYPADWLPPATQEGITFTGNISGTVQLQVRTYPNWTGDLATLQNDVLGTFGQVSVLLQEPVTVGPAPGVAGMHTAYGYDSAEQGPRTGAFVTFVQDGTGIVIDLDGPREAEATTVATLATITATWQRVPPRLGFGDEPWSTLNVGDFRVRYPTGFAYQAYNNWQRFAADPQTFVAVRIQPAARTAAEAMSSLLATASEGVAGFTADEPERFFYAGHIWERNDFTYTAADGRPISGLLLSRQDGEMEVAVWGEAPDPATDLFETIFLPTAAGIERIVAAPSG